MKINATDTGNNTYLSEHIFTSLGTDPSQEYFASVLLWLDNAVVLGPGESSVSAFLTLPSGSGSCVLCSSDAPPAQCLPPFTHACRRSVPLSGSTIDPLQGGSMRFSALLQGRGAFRAQFQLSTTGQADDTVPPPSQQPSQQPSYQTDTFSGVTLNTTSISVWFFIILTIVFLCAWRVYRQHRMNLLMGGLAGGRGAGGGEEEDCPPGLLRARELALSPLHVTAVRAHSSHPVEVFTFSAEARVLGPASEADGRGAGHDEPGGAAPVVLTAQAVAVEGLGDVQMRRL